MTRRAESPRLPFAEADCVPIGALHWLGHDCPATDLTSHPSQDGVRKNSPCEERQRPSAPDEKAVLREEVGEVPPRPEWRRVISSPFATDEELLDRDAEQDQTDCCEHQSRHSTNERLSAQSQQTEVQNRVDHSLGEGEYSDAEYVIQEDPVQKEGETRQSVGFFLCLK